jgi:Fur family transcriptional regulator, ferric uptake regulator
MGFSPFRDSVKVDDLNEALSALRESGHRVTAPRRLVLEALFGAEGPVSAEYVAAGMDGSSTPMDAASVHRILSQLEELGLVRHVHIGHGPGLYALVGQADREYLACERCGRVTTVDPGKLDSIRRSIRRRFGYEARFTHFPILGLCPGCRREIAGEEPPSARSKDGSHEHEHSHGGYVHSHPHVHGKLGGGGHEHGHEAGDG